ncbi:zinc finger protein 862-like [Gigantopelta aegis]|uniref:zinc finger protein 862-like n=1 Tax=Gigantopelta aegis TaxID=1735272 RepID=UPI001B88E54F|nr:zinc finger protein 862-like [Gigantopelta aegis]
MDNPIVHRIIRLVLPEDYPALLRGECYIDLPHFFPRICEPESGQADDIKEAMDRKCLDMKLDRSSLCVTVAADGASVNFGAKGGFLKKLQNEMPWIKMIHCLAHRLELALSDAFKETYYKDTVDDLMMHLYYMYRRSAKKWKELERLSESMNENIVKPSRTQGTRWIDHRRKALKTLERDYTCLVCHFEDMASGQRKDIKPADQAKMNGYLKILKSHKFILHVAAYQDFVEDLASLSLCLQQDDLAVSNVRTRIEAVCLSLKAKQTQYGRQLRSVISQTTEENQHTFRGVTLSSGANTMTDFAKHHTKLILNIIECIESRFATFIQANILMAADIFDPANLPTEQGDLFTYGNHDVDSLIDHFEHILSSQCDANAVHGEWMMLKLDLSKHHKTMTYAAIWGEMFTEKQNLYPNILQLVQIVLVLPISTFQVERQFSCIKRILGDWRLNLKLSTMEHLLRICSDGPKPVDFDPLPAVMRWNSSSVCSRRPDTS